MSKKLGPRGFRVEHPDYFVHWLIAESASKARWEMYSSARECGFPVTIGEFKVRRCPAIDGMKTIDPPVRRIAIVHSSDIGLGVLNPPQWEQP